MSNNAEFTPETFPSDDNGYYLHYNSHPRPEKYIGIQGSLRSTLEIHVPLIVSAPTGSGKTVVFELAIIRSLMNFEDLDITNFKIIYLAPTKALCHERLVDWQIKFNHLGVSCVEATGDHDVTELTELAKYKIIITTPEKWDTLTRRWKDFQNFVSEIKLFLIDEVHLVNENERGATLEVILSRMKTISVALNYNKSFSNNVDLRFVAVSATLPNIEDVAVWIGGTQAKFHKMPEEMRPIQLEKLVFGYPSNSYISYFRFDMGLNYKLGQLIQQYSGGKPTLVFCSTRKGVEMAANVLASSYSFISPRNTEIINELVGRVLDKKIIKLLSKGIAYHHGGLLANDRLLIEETFRNAGIPVLLCTSTLATGVNLPAHLVIIKSTQVYSPTGTNEYPESLILQMMGRAGRPQYDNSGVAIIMTQNNKVKFYDNMVSGIRPIESNLHKHLSEHLNAEIVLRTITDLVVAVQWIKSTFLYVRAIKNPAHYGFSSELNKEKVEQKLEELCLIAINSLEKHGLLTKDQLYGLTISPTISGKLMARCYLNFNTMKIFQQMNGRDGLTDLMLLISNCHEFSDYKLRMSDKRYLNELNSSKTTPLRFPIKGKVKTISDKIFILLQAVFGNVNCAEPSLYQETTKIIRIAEKISKAMVQYISLSEQNLTTEQFKTVYSALILSKCCTAKMWENSPFVSKQLNKIGYTYSKLLVEAGKTTFESIYETSARELETILHRAPPFGNLIHEAISKLPYFNINLILINSDFCRLKVMQTNVNCLMGRNCYEKITVIVGDSLNNLLFLKQNVSFFLLDNKEFEKNIKIIDPNVEVITAHVIHSSLVGLDKHTQLRLKPVPTESQEAFKTKPTVPKKLGAKHKTTIKPPTAPLAAPHQTINPNLSLANINQSYFDLNHECDSNKIHDNCNDDKDHVDDYCDIEISQQHRMIFNKCRDQGIDHDQDKYLNNSNFSNNLNTTIIIDGNRSSSSPINRKFIKKTRISKNDFTTTIVPSQPQIKLLTQELENEICTGVNKDGDCPTYRVVEILEKKVDSAQKFKFKTRSINSENINNILHETNKSDRIKEPYCITEDDCMQHKSIIMNDEGRIQNLNQENDLNVINLKVAETAVVDDDCVNKLKANQLESYNCSTTKSRSTFPSTPSICRTQRSTTNKPNNNTNLLRSICDRDAFSDIIDFQNNTILLNAGVIDEITSQAEQSEIDYKLLLSQRHFMEEQLPNYYNNSQLTSSKVSDNPVKPIDDVKLNKCVWSDNTFKDNLKSYNYEVSKKPKIQNSNFSIMNFINEKDEPTGKHHKHNEHKTFCTVPPSNTSTSLLTGLLSPKNIYEPFYEQSPAPTAQEKIVGKISTYIKHNDKYTTPPKQQYGPVSPSSFSNYQTPTNFNRNTTYLTPCKERVASYLESDENDDAVCNNTVAEDDNEFLNFFKLAPSLLFSQTNPEEMEMWEQHF